MPQQPDPRRKPSREPNEAQSHDPFIMDTRRNAGNRRASTPKKLAGSDAKNSAQASDNRGDRRPDERRTSRQNSARPVPVRRPQAKDGNEVGTPRDERQAPRRPDRGESRPRQREDERGVTPRTRPSRPTSPAGAPRGTDAPRPGRSTQRQARPMPVRGQQRTRPAGDMRYDATSGAYISDTRDTAPLEPQGPRRPTPAASPGGPQGPRGPHRDGGDGADGGSTSAGGKRRFGRGKKIVAGFLVLALLWFAGLIWAGTSAWDKVAKIDAMPEHTASKGSGTNILLVGSDARTGLTNEQKRKLGTGSAEGQRTDSIMVLHIGGPKPTLMSIPRDSYVAIPGYGKNKINAAFSIGGPKLLIKTIEQDTGIYINNYMEIGFGGFASVVDAVGGVRICVAFNMDDKKAHINLKKGCQTLNGANALGYVRARYSDPEGDIGRAKRQRQFLGALMKKISSPTNLLFPWKLKGLGESGAQGLTVDKGMGVFTAGRAMWTLKGFSSNNGNSVVVPLDNSALYTPVGEAVEWDPAKSEALFKAVRENQDTAPYVTKTAASSATK